MSDPRLTLKDPWFAGVLAFLIPGAGHLYQGRVFKALLYAVCIWGLFLAGMKMTDWQAMQAPGPNWRGRGGTGLLLKFAAQSSIGLPALVGLIQTERFYSQNNKTTRTLPGKIEFTYHGSLDLRNADGQLEHDDNLFGVLKLEPVASNSGRESIQGQLVIPVKDKTYHLENVELSPPIGPEHDQLVQAEIYEKAGDTNPLGRISEGRIPRPMWNWVGTPLDQHQEKDLHRRLGKFHELAMLFTYIASFLNFLAIWDAVEGPAYGYGDEEPSAAPAPAGAPT